MNKVVNTLDDLGREFSERTRRGICGVIDAMSEKEKRRAVSLFWECYQNKEFISATDRNAFTAFMQRAGFTSEQTLDVAGAIFYAQGKHERLYAEFC